MKLEFHPEAELEFIEAAAYYERRVAGLGQRFGADVRRTLDMLLAHPEMGIAVDVDLRKYALRRFPFSLIYSLSPDVLRVEVLAHQSRRPGYWRWRIER